MKTKIHNLKEEDNFCLVAISSHLSDYKISWLFNESLNFTFQQADDLIRTDIKEQSETKFSTFKSEDSVDSIFTLFSNRSGNEILVKSIKSIDYILKFQGKLSEEKFKQLIDNIRKLKNIITVFQIDLSTLKPKELELFY